MHALVPDGEGEDKAAADKDGAGMKSTSSELCRGDERALISGT